MLRLKHNNLIILIILLFWACSELSNEHDSQYYDEISTEQMSNVPALPPIGEMDSEIIISAPGPANSKATNPRNSISSRLNIESGEEEQIVAVFGTRKILENYKDLPIKELIFSILNLNTGEEVIAPALIGGHYSFIAYIEADIRHKLEIKAKLDDRESPAVAREVPSISLLRVTPEVQNPGQYILLEGNGFGKDKHENLVIFPNIEVVPNLIVDIGNSLLPGGQITAVKVPWGAENGEVKVKRGDEVSNGVYLEVKWVEIPTPPDPSNIYQ